MKLNEIQKFRNESLERIEKLSCATALHQKSFDWIEKASTFGWTYNFTWLSLPAIQFPNDMWAIQELINLQKPDLIIETGIARGGSLVFYASMLALLDLEENSINKTPYLISNSRRKVLGIDIDIKLHNRNEIEKHPLSSLIEMIEGSSTGQETLAFVNGIAKKYTNIMVILDSNHTEEHVLKELEEYSKLISGGGFLIVLDTVIEFIPGVTFADRSWGIGNNPFTAVRKFLCQNPDFIAREDISNKLSITVAPGGFLQKIQN
jgi:cephalosporin hydroxylase